MPRVLIGAWATSLFVVQLHNDQMIFYCRVHYAL
jgi:hypothetical protein